MSLERSGSTAAGTAVAAVAAAAVPQHQSCWHTSPESMADNHVDYLLFTSWIGIRTEYGVSLDPLHISQLSDYPFHFSCSAVCWRSFGSIRVRMDDFFLFVFPEACFFDGTLHCIYIYNSIAYLFIYLTWVPFCLWDPSLGGTSMQTRKKVTRWRP